MNKQLFLFAFLLMGAVGCADDSQDRAPTDTQQEFSREEARRDAGKNDGGPDICALAQWYGDGVCDPFCAEPDPDCADLEGEDICEELGWYGDGVCDGICLNLDPDCETIGADLDEACGEGIRCQEGLTCQFAACGDARGTCQELGAFCPELYAPVCGCDGQTYSSACHAAAQGMPVLYSGECDDDEELPTANEGEFCSGSAEIPCAEGLYCLVEACGDAGVCQARAEICPELYAPVCGCDNETYSSACHASSRGVSVASQGECGAAPAPAGEDEPCGGEVACEEGLYCRLDACGDSGVCRLSPEICPEVYSPVCGCDGQTYSNSCHAASRGASVAAQGACP